jgi:hypothetical protein
MSVASYKGVRAVFICAEDQFRVAFEQRRNFADVAFPGSVVNLAAEGETTPKQSDQGDSSGAVRNGEIKADSAEQGVHIPPTVRFNYIVSQLGVVERRTV